MAGSATDYFENLVLNYVKGGATVSAITPYVALFTAITNGETGSVTEVTGGSYARKLITFGAPSGGSMTNSGQIDFTTPTAGWGSVVGWGIYDALTTGNLIFYDSITPQQVDSGVDVSFLAGGLGVSYTHATITNYFRDKILNVLRGTGITPSITPHMGLYTVAPTASTTGTECTGGSYIRKSITFGSPSGGSITTTGTTTFATPTSPGWGTVVATAISDAISAGNQLYFQGGISKTINESNSVSFATANITVSAT